MRGPSLAHGSVGWSDEIQWQRSFSELMAEVEAILIDEDASKADLEFAKNQVESVKPA